MGERSASHGTHVIRAVARIWAAKRLEYAIVCKLQQLADKDGQALFRLARSRTPA